jgi:hypothetical protein
MAVPGWGIAVEDSRGALDLPVRRDIRALGAAPGRIARTPGSPPHGLGDEKIVAGTAATRGMRGQAAGGPLC